MNSKLLFLLILILLFVIYNFIKKREEFFPGMSSDEDFLAPGTPEGENTIESTIQNLITGTDIIDVNTPDEDSSIIDSGLNSQQVSNQSTSQTDFLTQTMRKFNQNDFSPSPSYGGMFSTSASYGNFSNDLNSHLPEDKNLTPLTKAAYLYHESLGPAGPPLENTPIIDYEKEWRHYPSKFEDRQEGPLKRLEREKKIFKGKKKPFDRELNFNIFDTAVKLELHKLSNIKYNFKLLKNLLYVDANDSNSTNIKYSSLEIDEIIEIYKKQTIDDYLFNLTDLYYGGFTIFLKDINDDSTLFSINGAKREKIDLLEEIENTNLKNYPKLFKFLKGNLDFINFVRKNYDLKDILNIVIDHNFLYYVVITKKNVNHNIKDKFIEFNLEINVDYFYIPFNEFNFDKSRILVEKISEIQTCNGILSNHFFTGDLKKKDYFTMFKLNDYMYERDMEEELYTNLLLLLKLIFKNKENLKNKASEYSKYSDFNLSNYKDTNILETNYFSFYDLLEIHNFFQILQKWDTLNIENENILKIMFGFQDKPQSVNDNNIKEYKNIYTNDNSKTSKPLTSIDLNNDENKFDFYTYQFSRDLKISSYFFNSGIEYAESEIKEIADSLLKYMNNKEMTTKNVKDFFNYEKTSAINLITDIFSNKSNLLDNSLVLQKKGGSDSIFEIVGYDLNLNLKDSVNNSFADSDYDNFIIQKLRGYLNNFNNIFEYIRENYNIGNLNLIILDAYLHNVVILKTDLNNKINEDKSIDLKINYTLDLFNVPFKDYKLNSKSLRIKLLKISDFFEKKYYFTDKIIQKKIDYIWNKISILMENSDLSFKEKEELKKLKQDEEKFNFHHGKFIKELKNLSLDKENLSIYEENFGFDSFNLQIILLKNIFNNSNKFKEFIDEIISGIDYTPEEFRESHYFYVNPKFLNYKKTKIKNNELYFDFLIEHSIADTVTKELEIYILKTKSKPLKNFEEFKKDRCKNKKLDGSVTWVDNEIFNSWSCIDYQKYGICKDGKVIDEGNKLLDLNMNFGTLTADQACCVCGGGTDEAELIKPVEGKNKIKLKVEDVSIHEMTEKHKETLKKEIVDEFNTLSDVTITTAEVDLIGGSIIIIITLPENKSQTETIKIVEKANSIEINIPTRVGIVTSKPKVEVDSKLNKAVKAAQTHQSTQSRRTVNNNNNNNNVEPQPCSEESRFADFVSTFGEGVYQFKPEKTSNIFLPNIMIE